MWSLLQINWDPREHTLSRQMLMVEGWLIVVKDANDALRRDPKLVGKYIEKAAPMLSKNLVGYRLKQG